MVRRRLLCAAAVAAAAIASLAPATPVAGSDAQPSVVSAVPSASTPHAVDDAAVANAAVHTFTQVGGVMYAGGQFHSVQDPRRTTTFERHNLFSFDVATGQPTDWAPQVNGEVFRTLYVAPYLYVGGSFTVADGVQERLVRYRVDSGTPVIDDTWHPERVGAAVSDLERVQGRLIVAGAFKKKLIALDPSTGEDTGYLNLPITGTRQARTVPADRRLPVRGQPGRHPAGRRSATSPPSAGQPQPAPSCSTSARPPRPSPPGTTSR